MSLVLYRHIWRGTWFGKRSLLLQGSVGARNMKMMTLRSRGAHWVPGGMHVTSTGTVIFAQGPGFGGRPWAINNNNNKSTNQQKTFVRTHCSWERSDKVVVKSKCNKSWECTVEIVDVVGGEPLVEDRETEISEDWHHKNELWKKFKENILHFAKVNTIQQLHEKTQHHLYMWMRTWDCQRRGDNKFYGEFRKKREKDLSNTDKNRKFHFERVVVTEFIFRVLNIERLTI